MGKKKSKNGDINEELEHVDENLIVEDIPDDILLNEDLDDPLFDELDAILQGKTYKPKPNIKQRIQAKEISNKKSKNTARIETSKAASIGNLKINKQILKELKLFLLKKSKIYEEISFQTMLRKIPNEWGFSEANLIDAVENIIENKGITSINLKMTANSIKFYPIKKNKST